MKRIWIMALCSTLGLVLSSKGHASLENDEMNMEVEAEINEADGIERSAAYLDEKVEQEKLNTQLDKASASRAIREAKTVQVKAEANIAKAETAIQALRLEQAQALAARKAAINERTIAAKKLQVAIKQLKAQRARTAKIQANAKRHQNDVKYIQTRLANIQKKMPVKKTAMVLKLKRTPAQTASSKLVPSVRR